MLVIHTFVIINGAEIMQQYECILYNPYLHDMHVLIQFFYFFLVHLSFILTSVVFCILQVQLDPGTTEHVFLTC